MVIKCLKCCFILCFIHLAFGYEYQLTFGPSDDTAPDWSPDGSHICFASNRSGNYEIYIIPSTGGTAVNITNNPALDISPHWSPDGNKIAFVLRSFRQSRHMDNVSDWREYNANHNFISTRLFTCMVTGWDKDRLQQ